MRGSWAGKRVLVTGGSGFLGQPLCRLLERARPAALLSPRRADFDLTQPDAVEKLFVEAEPDVVFHLAARVGGIGANMAQPADLYLSNLLMGTYVIEEARRAGVPKTVVVGTICSYPAMAPVPFRESSLWEGYPDPTNAAYGVAKKALLVQAQSNRVQYGQNVIYLMPTNLYGPGDKFHPAVSHVIPALIRRFVDAREQALDGVEVWGSGKATREFLFVDDAAEALVMAAERYDGAEPVNLGSGSEIAIADLAPLIASLVGYTGEVVWDRERPDGQARRLLDTSAAAAAFGWRATTDLQDGLERTISWYQRNRLEAEAVTAL
jgi:GDP-L-fucose synthase